MSMTKSHLLYWMFDYLTRKHPEVLKEMEEQIAGDVGDKWVKAALAERLAAYEEVRPAGYKFLGEFRREGQTSLFEDVVVADPDRNLAETQAKEHLRNATKVDVVVLSRADLAALKLEQGQIRTKDGVKPLKN
jgi:hypothetical protein